MIFDDLPDKQKVILIKQGYYGPNGTYKKTDNVPLWVLEEANRDSRDLGDGFSKLDSIALRTDRDAPEVRPAPLGRRGGPDLLPYEPAISDEYQPSEAEMSEYRQKIDRPGGFVLPQLALSPEQREEAARKGKAKAFKHSELSKLLKDEGGIFQYEFYDPRRKDTLTISRKDKLTPQDLEFIKQTYAELNQREGADPLTHKFTMVDDPLAVFKYVMDNKLIDNPENLPMEAFIDKYKANPTGFREIAMGEEPSFGGRFGDTASRPGRQVMSLQETLSPDLPAMLGGLPEDATDDEKLAASVEGARLQSDSDSFLGKVGGDMLRSPTLPLSLAASLAPFPVPGGFKTKLLKEGLIGGAEGLAETASSKQQFLADPDATDYGLNTLMGAGAGAGFVGAGEGFKKSAGKIKDKFFSGTGDKIRNEAYDLWKDIVQQNVPKPLQVGPLNPNTPAAKKILGGKRGDEYEKGALSWYKDRLGIKNEDDLYPGLGLANRNSAAATDLRALATRSPKLYRQWENTYQKLIKGIDKQINYSKAPTLEGAGDLMVESAKKAKDKFFSKRQNTYKNILQSDKGLEIDKAMDDDAVKSFKGELEKLVEDLQSQKNKASRMEDTVEEVPTLVPSNTIVDPSGQPAMVTGTKQQVTGQKPVLFDNPKVAPKVNAAIDAQIERAKGLIVSLDSRLNGSLPAGTKNKDGNTLAFEINKVRSSLQNDAVMGNPLEKNPIEDKVISDLRDMTRDFIMDATKKADPSTYETLKKTNEEITNFLKDMAFLKKDLDPTSLKDAKAVAKAVMGNSKKLGALKKIFVGYGNSDVGTFNQIRDAWMKHKLIRTQATTGEVKDKLLGTLDDNKELIKDLYNNVSFEELKMYIKGLTSIGDPQLIGLSGQLKDVKDAVGLPASPKEAVTLMKALLLKNQKEVDPQDTKRLADILTSQESALTSELGEGYAKPTSLTYKTLSNLNNLGGPPRGKISKGRAVTDVSDDESRQVRKRKKDIWEVISK